MCLDERFETFEINTGTCTFKFFCLQSVVVDSLMTLDTKSPDQSATENDYARTM